MEPTMHMEQGRKSLPGDLQKHCDHLVSWLIETEKQSYRNEIVPFSQHSEQMKLRAQEFLCEVYSEFLEGEKVAVQHIKVGDPSAASLANWEKAKEQLQEKLKEPEFPFITSIPLQEQIDLSWAFMEDGYMVAKGLLENKKYQDAKPLFFFICFLHPQVFEYWIGLAACQQGLGEFKDAIDTYYTSLFFQPENPIIYFQIAGCFYQLKDVEQSLKAMDLCLQYAKDNEKYAALFKEAKEIQEVLQAKKVA